MDALEDQGVTFRPGVHMRWGFHASSPEAVASIVNDPLHGFTVTLAGETGSLWGSGIYFARDASYSHHFAAKAFTLSATDAATGKVVKGAHQMLLCLVSMGMACLGGENVKVVLKVGTNLRSMLISNMIVRGDSVGLWKHGAHFCFLGVHAASGGSLQVQQRRRRSFKPRDFRRPRLVSSVSGLPDQVQVDSGVCTRLTDVIAIDNITKCMNGQTTTDSCPESFEDLSARDAHHDALMREIS